MSGGNVGRTIGLACGGTSCHDTISAGFDQYSPVLFLILNVNIGVYSVWHLGTVIKLHSANPSYRRAMICHHGLNCPCLP